MEKKLSVIGNSVGIIIDKPVCRLLGITENSWVKMWTDGRRIILEPFEKEKPSAPSVDDRALKLDAERTFRTLLHQGLEQRDYAVLSHKPGTWMEWLGWVNSSMTDATEQDLATMRRIEACLHGLRAGQSLNQALESALAAVPKN